MDLFAYNEDAFTTWVCELEGVALRNTDLHKSGATGTVRNSFIHPRPSSSHSSVSRASVAPSMNTALSHDSHVTREGEHSPGGNRTSASIFIAPSPQSLKACDKQDQSEEYAYSGDVI